MARHPSEPGGLGPCTPWLDDTTDDMDTDQHATLLAAVISALVQMVRDESGFSTDDAERLVELVSRRPDAVAE